MTAPPGSGCHQPTLPIRTQSLKEVKFSNLEAQELSPNLGCYTDLSQGALNWLGAQGCMPLRAAKPCLAGRRGPEQIPRL